MHFPSIDPCIHVGINTVKRGSKFDGFVATPSGGEKIIVEMPSRSCATIRQIVLFIEVKVDFTNCKRGNSQILNVAHLTAYYICYNNWRE
jgi:hypothetical protein